MSGGAYALCRTGQKSTNRLTRTGAHIGIDRRGAAGGQVAGEKRRRRPTELASRPGTRDRRWRRRARGTRARPPGRRGRSTNRTGVPRARAIPVQQHHALDLAGGGAQRHPHADLARAIGGDVRLDAVEARHREKERDRAEADRREAEPAHDLERSGEHRARSCRSRRPDPRAGSPRASRPRRSAPIRIRA